MIKITQVLYEIGEKINSILSKIKELSDAVKKLIIEVWGGPPIGKSKISQLSDDLTDLKQDYYTHKGIGGKWPPEGGAHWAKGIKTNPDVIEEYLREIMAISDLQNLYKEFLKHVGTRRIPDPEAPPSDPSVCYWIPHGTFGIRYAHHSGSIFHNETSLENYLKDYVDPRLLKDKVIEGKHFKTVQIPLYSNYVELNSSNLSKVLNFGLLIPVWCNYLQLRFGIKSVSSLPDGTPQVSGFFSLELKEMNWGIGFRIQNDGWNLVEERVIEFRVANIKSILPKINESIHFGKLEFSVTLMSAESVQIGVLILGANYSAVLE